MVYKVSQAEIKQRFYQNLLEIIIFAMINDKLVNFISGNFIWEKVIKKEVK